MPQPQRKYLVPIICLALAGTTLLLFLPLTTYDFINYDDRNYVTENAQVKAGLSWQGVIWALTTTSAANWHPLTWLSHMSDCQFFGLRPGAHHTTSVVLHMANSVLLFLCFRSMTQAVWPSAFVAALFAWHPAHVESVAWISERKDVLSTLFFLLSLWAYARYVKHKTGVGGQKPEAQNSILGIRNPTSILLLQPSVFYTLSLFFFALGLMSKQMLVTLPFVLLLLDFWPLRRVHMGSGTARIVAGLFKEKLPFFALAAGASAATFMVQRSAGAMLSLERLSIPERIANALISYCRYIGKLLWPQDLCIYYPHPGEWPTWQVVAASIFILLMTGMGLWFLNKKPYILVGWLWFLGSLVPVLGLVQVGSQSMADRYSYIPFIGLFLVLGWGIPDILARIRHREAFLMPLSATVLVVLAVLTAIQVRFWKSSESLFSHALAVTKFNLTAQLALGCALVDNGKTSDALPHLEEALRLDPNLGEAHARVAYIRAGEGKFDEAIAHYQLALKSKPDLTEALNNLAWLMATHPDPRFRNGPEAVRLAERACRLTHDEKTIFIGTLAAAYAEAGRFEEAIAAAQKARNHALKWDETFLAEKNRQLLEVYRAGNPARDTPNP
jgi:Tfp pilus assembly protein PilF